MTAVRVRTGIDNSISDSDDNDDSMSPAAIETSGYSGYDINSLFGQPLTTPAAATSLSDGETSDKMPKKEPRKRSRSTPGPSSSKPLFSCLSPGRAARDDEDSLDEEVDGEGAPRDVRDYHTSVDSPSRKPPVIPATCTVRGLLRLTLVRELVPHLYQSFRAYCIRNYAIENLLCWQAYDDVLKCPDADAARVLLRKCFQDHFLPESDFPVGCTDLFRPMVDLCDNMDGYSLQDINKRISSLRYIIEDSSLQDPLVRWAQGDV
ncbi:MAG: hypothetical protein Q8P67_06710 [archaeon]|nr:hypothetical protein [archaeon]